MFSAKVVVVFKSDSAFCEKNISVKNTYFMAENLSVFTSSLFLAFPALNSTRMIRTMIFFFHISFSLELK